MKTELQKEHQWLETGNRALHRYLNRVNGAMVVAI